MFVKILIIPMFAILLVVGRRRTNHTKLSTYHLSNKHTATTFVILTDHTSHITHNASLITHHTHEWACSFFLVVGDHNSVEIMSLKSFKPDLF